MNITLAEIRMIIDFPTKEDALSYIEKNKDKNWIFTKPKMYSKESDSKGDQWSITVQRPYKDCNFDGFYCKQQKILKMAQDLGFDDYEYLGEYFSSDVYQPVYDAVDHSKNDCSENSIFILTTLEGKIRYSTEDEGRNIQRILNNQ